MERLNCTVSQAGMCVKVKGMAGVIRCQDTDTTLGSLPTHPNPEHKRPDGAPAYVLPQAVADLTLEELALPAQAAVDTIYVGSASTPGQDPFVHVVWYTPQTADEVTGRGLGSHAASTDAVHEVWRRDVAVDHSRWDSTSPASGKYVELGVGVMAGGGRGSLEVAGKGTTVPFPRHARESDLLEGELGEMMSDVSEVLHEALPETMKAHAAPLGCPIAAVNAYQYPSLRVGVPPLSSHQVVIRGPCMTREEGCTEEEADHAAYMSVSDLHVDVMDGGGAAGSCTVHTCHASGEGGWKEPSPPSVGARRQLRGRGLAVFPTKTGGRGVHIISMVPGWHCAIIMQTGSRLHGSVIVEEPDMVGFALSHLRLMRVVTYPLIQVENLLKRLAQDPEKLEEVRRASKEWVARRMHGERVVA